MTTTPMNSTPALKLFSVTLFWGEPGSDEGDYGTMVWAKDHDSAIRQTAEEMADSGEKSFDSDADRTAYIDEVVANAGIYAAEEVTVSLGLKIEALLAGPGAPMSPRAMRDLHQVKKILARYGVPA